MHTYLSSPSKRPFSAPSYPGDAPVECVPHMHARTHAHTLLKAFLTRPARTSFPTLTRTHLPSLTNQTCPVPPPTQFPHSGRAKCNAGSHKHTHPSSRARARTSVLARTRPAGLPFSLKRSHTHLPSQSSLTRYLPRRTQLPPLAPPGLVFCWAEIVRPCALWLCTHSLIRTRAAHT